MVIAGPKYQFFAVNSNWPGSVHDARVLRESQLFRRFADGWKPFPNAVLLGDSAYPLLSWLMTEILAGELTDAERRFNIALRRTRFVVENSLGILKSRFQCLKYIRVRDPKKAANCKCVHCSAQHYHVIERWDRGVNLSTSMTFRLMTAPPQKRSPQVCQVDKDKKDWLGGIESSV